MAKSEGKKAVFLDRDGVLNDLVDRGDTFSIRGMRIRWTAPFTLDEVKLKPNIRDALILIRAKGYLPIMTTNQPDVAHGLMRPDEFERIMRIFFDLKLLHSILACLHHPLEGCPCRKPKPGMLLEAKEKHGLDMAQSFMVGDMETDILAGIAAGVGGTVLITEEEFIPSQATHRARNVLEAAQLLP